jgi:hypothetical protein
MRFEGYAKVGALTTSRPFDNPRDASSWATQERERLESLRESASTAYASIRRRVLADGSERFYVEVTRKELYRHETRATLEAALAARERMRTELAFASRDISHPWRIRIRFHADGTRAYKAMVRGMGRSHIKTFQTLEEAEASQRAVASELGLRTEPVTYLWEQWGDAIEDGRETDRARPTVESTPTEPAIPGDGGRTSGLRLWDPVQ